MKGKFDKLADRERLESENHVKRLKRSCLSKSTTPGSDKKKSSGRKPKKKVIRIDSNQSLIRDYYRGLAGDEQGSTSLQPDLT